MGLSVLRIDGIGLYVRDTYDFHDDGQFLGYWSSEGVQKGGALAHMLDDPFVEEKGIRYWKVKNGDFNIYRMACGKGGDFMVFSTVEPHRVWISVHLNSTDFDEYNYYTRKKP